ncbi:hypothetical protein CLOM_g1125 [Closterium sp. NIES-68]|nr:hypothetical protein CLOM_g1125 [Closterium sp. NIES-68]
MPQQQNQQQQQQQQHPLLRPPPPPLPIPLLPQQSAPPSLPPLAQLSAQQQPQHPQQPLQQPPQCDQPSKPRPAPPAAAAAAAPLAEQVRAGFAKLHGEDFEYFVQSYSIVLGRNSKKSSVDLDLSALGGGMNVSRNHAKIFYDFAAREFRLEVLGKNGVYVDGQPKSSGSDPVPLKSQQLLQVGDKRFFFLLPAKNPQPPAKPGPLHQVRPPPGLTSGSGGGLSQLGSALAAGSVPRPLARASGSGSGMAAGTNGAMTGGGDATPPSALAAVAAAAGARVLPPPYLPHINQPPHNAPPPPPNQPPPVTPSAPVSVSAGSGGGGRGGRAAAAGEGKRGRGRSRGARGPNSNNSPSNNPSGNPSGNPCNIPSGNCSSSGAGAGTGNTTSSSNSHAAFNSSSVSVKGATAAGVTAGMTAGMPSGMTGTNVTSLADSQGPTAPSTLGGLLPMFSLQQAGTGAGAGAGVGVGAGVGAGAGAGVGAGTPFMFRHGAATPLGQATPTHPVQAVQSPRPEGSSFASENPQGQNTMQGVQSPSLQGSRFKAPLTTGSRGRGVLGGW